MTRIRASSPEDLLGLVPYLLGFHPSESVAAVLVGGGRVVMTARMDASELEQPDELAGYLLDLLAEHRAAALVLITYSGDPADRPRSEALVSRLGDLVADALLVDGQRWWSLFCDGCCPPEGLPYDPQSHPLSAAAVYAGLTALPDREALRAQVAGPPAEQRPALERLHDRAAADLVGLGAATRKRLVRKRVREALAGDRRLTDAECAELAVLVFHLGVRDVAWAQLTRADADRHVALWSQVVARAPECWASAPLCLLGVSAWVSGNGALQNCCVERVGQIDPGYTMAGLLADINRRALPPAYWDEWRESFRRDPRLMAG